VSDTPALPSSRVQGSRYLSPGALKEKLRRREYPKARGTGAPLPYAELRAASAFSFLAAASLPEDLVQRAAELDLGAVALIDRNGVYGAPRFYRAAREAGIKALVGAEVVLDEPSPEPRDVGGRASSQLSTLNSQPTGRGEAGGRANSQLSTLNSQPAGRGNSGGRANSQLSTLNSQPAGRAAAPPRLTLLVESRAGYRNLCRLLTAAARGRPKGEARADWDLVAAHAGGLRCLTGGGEGPLARTLAAAGPAAARRRLEELVATFDGRVHVEVQRHGARHEEHRNAALVELARALGLPLVATNGVRYARREDKPLADVLTCIREHTHLDAAGALLAPHRERHLKGAAEMARRFADLPAAVAESAALAGRLAFTLADLGYRFPAYPLPPGETPASYLRAVTWSAAPARFRPLTARAQAQLEKELAVIEKLDLAGYFLIVWDVVRFCQRQGILAQGRGSAANSAVCYALSITAVDPVKMNLLFERFLSEERGEWPDIDLDLPSGDQREKVIQYVYGRYGPHGAAMTANVITYRDRSATREVAKALGYSGEQIEQLAKRLGTFSYDRVRGDDKSLAVEIAAAGFDPEERRMLLFRDLWQRIHHLPRHLGQHSGGMVVAAGRLDEVVPLEPSAMPERVVVQWDKDDCADLGIVKIDLLGLGMLCALEEAVPLVRQMERVNLDLAHLPPDDPATFAMIRRADTVGVFQIESRAQMASLPRHAPERFYDLVVQVAIIRPGPIVGGMVHPFFERRRGRQPVTYPHPCLAPILERTLGVPLFQEQILRVAMAAAGFTGGEAEELRRAMGFKRSVERMRAIEQRLRQGMSARGIDGEAQEQIVTAITSFALYGFPESHAASFALIAYASAYLKAHHPTAFFVGLLNAWPMGFYHPASLIKDAQRHGVAVHPIDVNRSGWRCRWEARRSQPGGRTGEGGRGNSQLSTLNSQLGGREGPAGRGNSQLSTLNSQPGGRAAAGGRGNSQLSTLNSQLGGRAAAGAIRLGLRYVRGLKQATGEAVEAEAARAPFAGVRDLVERCRLGEAEVTALAGAGALASLGLSRRQALWQVAWAAKPAGPLFAGQESSASPLVEMSPLEETVADFRATGLTVGAHPVAYFRRELAGRGVTPAADLDRLPAGRRVKIGGSVIVRQRPGTAKGILFVTLEDETGMVQAVIDREQLKEHRRLIVGAPGLVIEGILEKRDGSLSVRARTFAPLGRLEPTPSHDFR
jgi:error-prone DNA polymerase